jgi:hypothetical protein
MQVRDSLIVKSLRLRRRGGDRVVDLPNAFAQGYGPLQDLARNPAHGIPITLVFVLS